MNRYTSGHTEILRPETDMIRQETVTVMTSVMSSTGRFSQSPRATICSQCNYGAVKTTYYGTDVSVITLGSFIKYLCTKYK